MATELDKRAEELLDRAQDGFNALYNTMLAGEASGKVPVYNQKEAGNARAFIPLWEKRYSDPFKWARAEVKMAIWAFIASIPFLLPYLGTSKIVEYGILALLPFFILLYRAYASKASASVPYVEFLAGSTNTHWGNSEVDIRERKREMAWAIFGGSPREFAPSKLIAPTVVFLIPAIAIFTINFGFLSLTEEQIKLLKIVIGILALVPFALRFTKVFKRPHDEEEKL